MFDDLGTNFIFVNNTQFDSSKRNAPTYMKLYVTEDAMAYDCYPVMHDTNSSLYYDLMVYEKDGNNYNQYKRTINNYFQVLGVETNVISAKEYKRRINSVIQFLLLPLANYEKEYTKTDMEPSVEDGIPENACLYTLGNNDVIEYNFKASGMPVRYRYKNVQNAVENGKIMQVIYELEQTINVGATNEQYYYYEMYSYARNVCENSDVSSYVNSVKSYV